MSALAHVCESVEAHARFVADQVRRARKDAAFRAGLFARWKTIRESVGTVRTPTGLALPALALPQTDEPGEVARFLFAEGIPGEFPFVNGVYREIYRAPVANNPQSAIAPPSPAAVSLRSARNPQSEEPTRLFAGLGLAEDTNERFHFLTQHQRSIRLSTAFDGPTLYGLDSDADGVFGKIGEGGVAIDTIDDVERLFARFPLGSERLSVSMTINGPAPVILAMYVAAARRRFGPRLSFFLDCGLDLEYLALARVCRKIWAIGMRDVFGAGERAQLFRLHTQTSGRSLIAHEFKNNLTRTAVELLLAYINATNSCHSNSADEPFTTPGEEYVRLAANAQSILLEETGLFRHMTNLFGGSPGMQLVGQAVERAILDEFRTLDGLGGVLAATELRYQRAQIQVAAHRYEQQIADGTRPIIGLNRYVTPASSLSGPKVVRTPRNKKQLQVDRLRKFKQRHAAKSDRALDSLARVVESGGNVFAELIKTVEHCSLGQITGRLFELVGRFRPSV